MEVQLHTCLSTAQDGVEGSGSCFRCITIGGKLAVSIRQWLFELQSLAMLWADEEKPHYAGIDPRWPTPPIHSSVTID